MKETTRRRAIQVAYNTEHGITPTSIKKKIHDITEHMQTEHKKAVNVLLDMDKQMFAKDPAKLIAMKEKEMLQAVKDLDFETAAILRDEIKELTGEAPKKKVKKGKK